MTIFDELDLDQLRRDVVNIAIFEIDEVLRGLANRQIISHSEVVDMVLDIRSCLNVEGYRDARHRDDVPRERRDPEDDQVQG